MAWFCAFHGAPFSRFVGQIISKLHPIVKNNYSISFVNLLYSTVDNSSGFWQLLSMANHNTDNISAPHLFGYARASTLDQNPQSQIDALLAAGVAIEDIYHEKASSGGKRRKLEAMLKDARKGDVIVVWKLDRLGRTVMQVFDTFATLADRGLAVRVLTQPDLDTSTPMGRIVITLLAAVAEMERDLIRERTQAGLEAARRQGRVGGSKPRVTDDQVRSASRRIAHGEGSKAVADSLGISRQALYKRMKDLREQDELGAEV